MSVVTYRALHNLFSLSLLSTVQFFFESARSLCNIYTRGYIRVFMVRVVGPKVSEATCTISFLSNSIRVGCID